MQSAPIYLDGNDDRPMVYLDTVDTANPPNRIAAVGISGLTFRWSATADGTAIDGTLSKSAADLGNGYYSCVMEGSDITSHLSTYAGKFVYQVFGDGGNINHCLARKVYAVRT